MIGFDRLPDGPIAAHNSLSWSAKLQVVTEDGKKVATADLPSATKTLVEAQAETVVARFAAWSFVFGKKPDKEQTKEFHLAGQLADMGPVKELVEQTGLLIQPQIRTNLHLEKAADALTKSAVLYEELRNEAEIEAEVERRMDLERRTPRRNPPAE